MNRRPRTTITALALAGSLSAAALSLVGAPAVASTTPSCTHAALSPYVQNVRTSSASLVSDLVQFGGSSSAISAISIKLANGTRVGFAFANGHFTLRGNAIPTTCKSLTATDDWEF